MRIFLTGFMGSGKTYVGKQLAHLMQLPFLDLDDVIEEQTQMSIRQIFEELGESHFRKIESDTLRSLQKYESVIIATGGGTPCHDQNMDWMNNRGLSVFLDVSVPILLQRLQGERSHRPLLQKLTDAELEHFIQEKRSSRLDCYRSAMVIYQQKEWEEEVAQHLFTHLPNVSGH